MARCLVSVVIGTISACGLAQGQLLCAPKGQALCGEAQDMAIVNTTDFAHSISRAGLESVMKKIPGAQAMETVIGKGVLSAGCLVCQGAAIDCAAHQRDCMSICMQSSCGDLCRTCMTRACSIEAACGGQPGKTIQEHFSCGTSNNQDKLTVMSERINLTFEGTCFATYESGNATQSPADGSASQAPSEDANRSTSATASTQLSGAVRDAAPLALLFVSVVATAFSLQ
eukprot:TRINITY_DN7693_c0_g1_i1.p1 TRINITY_DN7693_c0_g1~~TRINITY_DN7693_c0_g1_i1.p1  ORF type:complete len:248 (+),score=32.65 TRINITY_DN7693_c0_g1_i1:63-746(+)